MASGSDPLVSVVLPVHNREAYVAETIGSLLAQTHSRLELIAVVDGGSVDGSADIVRRMAAGDARIRPVFVPPCNQWRARNVGVGMARGAYVAHMDDDDVALPGRLAVQLAWMDRTGVDICGACIRTFGTRSHLMWFPESHQAIQHELLFRISLFMAYSMMRTEVARAFLFDEDLEFSDFVLLTRAAVRHRLGNPQQVLVRSRYHPGQIHVARHEGFLADQVRHRGPYFHALFPEATPEDFAALAGVLEKRPFTDLETLERAGRWLVRLGRTPDPFLRRRMADRWLAACLRSTHLGPRCHRLHREVAAGFEGVPPPSTLRLRAYASLRLDARSAVRAAAAAARRSLRSIRRPR